MQVEKTVGQKKKIQTDVCIIGAGSAGIGAALAASRSGANVILIEKESKVGGYQHNVVCKHLGTESWRFICT